MDEDDLEIENFFDKKKSKKKVNGCRKGKTVERHLCKILTEHFGVEFNRSVGSGNRWGQVSLSENAKQVFTGDVSVPENFKWVIESKGGYEKDVDLNTVCDNKGISRIDEFIKQSTHDSEFCGRKPMICWKRSRKPWLLMIRTKDLHPCKETICPYRIHYRDWIILPLEDFLKKTKKDFWFSS
jgi:Holliday junction resolvase